MKFGKCVQFFTYKVEEKLRVFCIQSGRLVYFKKIKKNPVKLVQSSETVYSWPAKKSDLSFWFEIRQEEK